MSATSSRASAAVDRTSSFPPTARFALLAGVGVAGVALAGVTMTLPPHAVAFATSATALAAVTGAVFLARWHPHALLGAANVVTLFRLCVVGVLAAILFAGTPKPAVVVPIAIGALLLDGVDGYLARRQRLQSRFGAAFDVEVDSAFALVLALLAASGPAGPVAVLLGLPRYLFGVAALALPWLNAPLEPRFSRKAICVAQLIALILLQLPGMPTIAAFSIVAAAAALLVWSFAVDIVHAWMVRGQVRA